MNKDFQFLILFIRINSAFCFFGFSQFPNQPLLSPENKAQLYQNTIDFLYTNLEGKNGVIEKEIDFYYSCFYLLFEEMNFYKHKKQEQGFYKYFYDLMNLFALATQRAQNILKYKYENKNRIITKIVNYKKSKKLLFEYLSSEEWVNEIAPLLSKYDWNLLTVVAKAVENVFSFCPDKEYLHWELILEFIKKNKINKTVQQKRRTSSGYMDSDPGSSSDSCDSSENFYDSDFNNLCWKFIGSVKHSRLNFFLHCDFGVFCSRAPSRTKRFNSGSFSFSHSPWKM